MYDTKGQHKNKEEKKLSTTTCTHYGSGNIFSMVLNRGDSLFFRRTITLSKTFFNFVLFLKERNAFWGHFSVLHFFFRNVTSFENIFQFFTLFLEGTLHLLRTFLSFILFFEQGRNGFEDHFQFFIFCFLTEKAVFVKKKFAILMSKYLE